MTSRTFSAIFLLVGMLALGPGGCGSDDSTVPVSQQDRYLHVSPNGAPQNDGSADNPLLFPFAAIKQAFVEGYRGVKLDTGLYMIYRGEIDKRLYGGIDVIGGCDPDTWQHVPGQYSKLSVPRVALLAQSIRVPTLVRGLELMASGTLIYNNSATVLSLDNCGPELQFQTCRFTARDGYETDQPGDDGWEPELSAEPDPGDPGDCNEAVVAAGGRAYGSGCTGGRGGDGGLPGEAGQDGRTGCGLWDSENTPGGEPGQDGLDGRDERDGEDGENATASGGIGIFAFGQIFPLPANNGEAGSSGQGGVGGGGGGGSATGTGNGGGSGGNGGNRGQGGQGGYSGGHSVAAICVNSESVFRQCRFTAGQGGDGTDGGNGSAGVPGSVGAPGGDACPGGVGRGGHGGGGGDGGDGGAGAGGHGGASYGLLIIGSVHPDTDADCSFLTGAPSSGGAGGQHSNGLSQGPDGLPGEVAEIKIVTLKSLSGSGK